MTPQVYNIENQYKGNTFDALTFRFIDGDDNPISLAGNIQVSVPFYGGYNTDEVQKELTLNNGVTIVDAADGRLQIDAFEVDLEVDTYQYEITITFPSGDVKTYVTGTVSVESRKTINE